ncbi:MAG TPA: ribonuclease HII [Abditibacteriaceae bacterium]
MNPPLHPTWQREDELRVAGFEYVIGVDEAGRGPLAGPVVAGAVILPRDFDSPHFSKLTDSKLLNEATREILYEEISARAAWGVGACNAAEIDQINIRQASWLAMQRAVAELLSRSTVDIDRTFVLIDGLPYGLGPWPYEAIVKGDSKSFSIAAGSIIAKVTRDRMMRQFDAEFPVYGFASHKGYGSTKHLAALETHGPCALHRKTYAPVRRILEKHENLGSKSV